MGSRLPDLAPMTIKATWIRPLAAASLLAAAQLARGQTPAPSASAGVGGDAEAQAAVHFEMGTRHYNLQEWAEAVKEYKEAYRLAPRLDFLWSIAQAQRLSGDCDAAVKTYQAFLRSSPTERQATLANEAVERCQAALLEKSEASPLPSAGEPARTAAAPAPSPSSAPAAPGTATPPVPTAAPSSPAPGHWYSDALGDVLFLGGIAVTAAGGVSLGIGNAKASEANGAADYATFERTRTEGPPLQTAGVIGLSVGGALVAAGVLRFVLVAGRRGSPPDAAVSAAAGPSGAGVRFSGRF